MVKEYFRCVLVALILSSIPQLEAARKDIYDFDDDQLVVDNKTRAMGLIARKCISNNNVALVVNEKLNERLIRYFHRLEITSVTSLASSKLSLDEWYSAALNNKEVYYDRHYYRFLSKSGGFLVAASSPVNLKEQLDNMKNSRWWNAAGFFIFIDDEEATTVESCQNAHDFLLLAWKYGLLSSVYLCQEQDGTVSIYSYNPYGDFAPQPWLMNREIKGQQGYPWRLFKWEKYDGRRYGCEDVFFSKTTSLNGYPILMNVLPSSPFFYVNRNKTGVYQYRGEDAWIMLTIWNFLNASFVDVPLADKDAALGWVDDDGTFHGNLIDISTGKVDIGWNSMAIEPLWKVTATYPHTALNFCFVTKSRGKIPWVFALSLIFDRWTMLGAATLFFFSTVIFGYVDKRRYFLSFLNAYRVFHSAAFVRPPKSSGLRMIICCIFILPIVTYSTMQGKILSLIKNPLRYAEIDTIDELNAMGYQVAGREMLKTVVPEELEHGFVDVKDIKSCFRKLYNDEPVACVNYCFTLHLKVPQNLHIASSESRYYQHIYIAKPDWPLIDRFNVLLQRIVQAGLIHAYRTMSIMEESTSYGEDGLSESTMIVMRLKDFRHLFFVHGIGCLCATLAFIGELIIGRSKTPKSVFKTRAKTLKKFKISRLVSRKKL